MKYILFGVGYFLFFRKYVWISLWHLEMVGSFYGSEQKWPVGQKQRLNWVAFLTIGIALLSTVPGKVPWILIFSTDKWQDCSQLRTRRGGDPLKISRAGLGRSLLTNSLAWALSTPLTPSSIINSGRAAGLAGVPAPVPWAGSFLSMLSWGHCRAPLCFLSLRAYCF